MLATSSPYSQYFDLDGSPLDGGSIYYGVANQDPLTSPIIVYWDLAGTAIADQPVRTISGYQVRVGAPALTFAPGDYSMTVRNSRGVQIFYAASALAYNVGLQITTELADGTNSANGAGMVGYNPVTAYASGLGKFLNYTFGRTAAEIAGGVSPTNYAYVPGHAYRYGTNTTPGTTDMTLALQATIKQAQQIGGADAIWPGDTHLVTGININGSNYRIRTAGGRNTVLKQAQGTSTTTGQILKFTGGTLISDIDIGDLAFVGNISLDSGEFHHCAYLFDDAGAATIKNITFGNLYGTNIRGDVLYVGGLAARPTTGIRFGVVSGTNVYRQLVSVVGGEVTGDSIIHDGPVGRADFDVEPNLGGYQTSTFILRYCRAAAVTISSADPALTNDCVSIDVLDCDWSRGSPSTPAYPTGFGVNAAAILVFYCKLLRIGYFKARNYAGIPVIGGTSALKSNVLIEVADMANCDFAEGVYNSLFADQGSGGIAYLEIGTLYATLTANTKMVFNGNGMGVRVRRGTVVGGLLSSNIPGAQYENMSVDMNGAAGVAVDMASNSYLQNVSFANAASATLMRNSQLNTLVNVSGTFATVEGAGCADNVVMHSTLNGAKYAATQLLGGNVLTKAMADVNQTLTALESSAPILITTGALTAQRNLVVSSAARMYSVFNNCSVNAIQVIAATGTGVVIGVGKRAIVQFDGTNVVRVSADV